MAMHARAPNASAVSNPTPTDPPPPEPLIEQFIRIEDLLAKTAALGQTLVGEPDDEPQREQYDSSAIDHLGCLADSMEYSAHWLYTQMQQLQRELLLCDK